LNNAELRKWKMPSGGRLKPEWVAGFTGICSEGVETKYIDKIPVKIYCIEKTIADTFKFRNKIGLDTATEALRAYIERKDKDLDKLMYYADVCRVSRVIRPYIEALI